MSKIIMGLLVGLTGTIGSGKSTAATFLRNLGAFIIDADAICRDLVLPDRPAWKEVVQTFGKNILQVDSQKLDRAKLAQIIFSDNKKKEQLESILHPKVIEEEKKLAEQTFKDHPEAIVVLEAALLFESGNDQSMDKVIVVLCDEEHSIQRVMKRSSLSRDEAVLRIQNQMPQAEKIKKADFVLHNNGSIEGLKINVQTLFSELKILTRL
jgi:dephospho-CoA kinase